MAPQKLILPQAGSLGLTVGTSQPQFLELQGRGIRCGVSSQAIRVILQNMGVTIDLARETRCRHFYGSARRTQQAPTQTRFIIQEPLWLF